MSHLELKTKINLKFRIFSCGLYTKENIDDGIVVKLEQQTFFLFEILRGVCMLQALYASSVFVTFLSKKLFF